MVDTELSVTNVGSHMWKMNHENSDTDLFQIYVTDTKELLRGNFDYVHSSSSSNNGKQGKEKVEIVRHELQKVIVELIDGNVNFLWGVMSPIVLNQIGYTISLDGEPTYGSSDYYIPEHMAKFPLPYPLFSYGTYLGDLKRIVIANPSKGIYNSIRGLAIANKKKYLDDPEISVEVKEKKVKIILRTLKFGINYLRGQGFIFEKPDDAFNNDLVKSWLQELDSAYRESLYPEHPDQTMFRDFLYHVRMVGLE
jgi:hypothetical protein